MTRQHQTICSPICHVGVSGVSLLPHCGWCCSDVINLFKENVDRCNLKALVSLPSNSFPLFLPLFYPFNNSFIYHSILPFAFSSISTFLLSNSLLLPIHLILYLTTGPSPSALSAPFPILFPTCFHSFHFSSPPPPSPGGSAARGEEQFTRRKPGPDGETQPVGLHRGYQQPSWTQTPPAADTTRAATGRNVQVGEMEGDFVYLKSERRVYWIWKMIIVINSF